MAEERGLSQRLRNALYTIEGYRTPEEERTRAYLKSLGYDLDDPKVMARFGDTEWSTNHFSDPPLAYQALTPIRALIEGEDAYQQRSDLGRANPSADATAVANPTIGELSLRGLYQSGGYQPGDRRAIQGFPKRAR